VFELVAVSRHCYAAAAVDSTAAVFGGSRFFVLFGCISCNEAIILEEWPWSISKPPAHANEQGKVSKQIEKQQYRVVLLFLSEKKRHFNPFARGPLALLESLADFCHGPWLQRGTLNDFIHECYRESVQLVLWLISSMIPREYYA
jgi:hypothetical protein